MKSTLGDFQCRLGTFGLGTYTSGLEQTVSSILAVTHTLSRVATLYNTLDFGIKAHIDGYLSFQAETTFTSHLGKFSSQLGNIRLGIFPITLNVSIGHIITFSDIVKIIKDATAFNIIVFVDYARRNQVGVASSTISFVGTVVSDRVKVIRQTITFTQARSVNLIKLVSPEDTLRFAWLTVVSDKIIGTQITATMSLAHTFNLDTVMNRSFSDSVTFVQTVELPQFGDDLVPVDHTTFATVVRNRQVGDILGVIDSVLVGLNSGQLCSSHLLLEQLAIGRKEIGYIKLELPERVIILPRPVFGDSQGFTNELTVKKSVNNKLYTTVKEVNTEVLKYSLQLDKQKALELYSFLLLTQGRNVKLTDWKDQKWIVDIVNNPSEFSSIGRSLNTRERMNIQLELEGELVG